MYSSAGINIDKVGVIYPKSSTLFSEEETYFKHICTECYYLFTYFYRIYNKISVRKHGNFNLWRVQFL